MHEILSTLRRNGKAISERISPSCHEHGTKDILTLIREALERAIANGRPEIAGMFAENLARHSQRLHGDRPDARAH